MYSFVVVWDKPGSGRITDIPSDLAPPFYTFAGEILNGKSSNILNAEHTKARGNAFACIAQSPDMVREQMKKSVMFFPGVIYKDALLLTITAPQGIWDMDTVQISALETVHTGNLTVDQTIE
ncbi:unnamed protein product [Penicillium discolor]